VAGVTPLRCVHSAIPRDRTRPRPHQCSHRPARVRQPVLGATAHGCVDVIRLYQAEWADTRPFVTPAIVDSEGGHRVGWHRRRCLTWSQRQQVGVRLIAVRWTTGVSPRHGTARCGRHAGSKYSQQGYSSRHSTAYQMCLVQAAYAMGYCKLRRKCSKGSAIRS